MKTINLKSLFIVVSLLSVSLFGMAKGLQLVQDTKQIIAEKIGYPAFAIEKHIEGIVEINFIIDSDGKIVIADIESESTELKNYVQTQIEGIRLSENLNDPKLMYSLKLNFNLK